MTILVHRVYAVQGTFRPFFFFALDIILCGSGVDTVERRGEGMKPEEYVFRTTPMISLVGRTGRGSPILKRLIHCRFPGHRFAKSWKNWEVSFT